MADNLKEEDAFIALNSLTGIGINNFHNLVEKFGTASAVFQKGEAELKSVNGIGPKTAIQISSCKPQAVADQQRKIADSRGTRIFTTLDEDYPANLRLFFKSPPVLYVEGEIKDENRIAAGIVGSRQPTPYGKIATEIITRSLVAKGFTTISGFARGIDTISHRTTIDKGGETIAVMGSGLDVIYPPENKNMFVDIKNNGAMVSQFPFGTEPDKRNFPVRNRIISGLSLCMVVVEAGEKSGALITAYASLDEGREVFAVPGRIDSPNSFGTNKLIQKGAKLIRSAEDILEELPPEVTELLNLEETEIVSKESSGEEASILEILSAGERHVDHIIEQSGLSSGVTLAILLELELKGSVRQLPGKLFARLS